MLVVALAAHDHANEWRRCGHDGAVAVGVGKGTVTRAAPNARATRSKLGGEPESDSVARRHDPDATRKRDRCPGFLDLSISVRDADPTAHRCSDQPAQEVVVARAGIVVLEHNGGEDATTGSDRGADPRPMLCRSDIAALHS